MRIVNRAEFLTLPPGTLYCKVPADARTCDMDAVCIKGDSMGNDWVVQELSGWFTDCDDTMDFLEAWDEMRAGGERAVELDCGCRDGLFDEDQRFAVFSLDDHVNLIARLTRALADRSHP